MRSEGKSSRIGAANIHNHDRSVLIPVDYHTDVALICGLMLIFMSLIIF